MPQTTYSTKEVAQKAAIDLQTLYRWIWAGKVKPSIQVTESAVQSKGRVSGLWTPQDLKAVLAYKKEHYRKGRGRKPAKAAASK